MAQENNNILKMAMAGYFIFIGVMFFVSFSVFNIQIDSPYADIQEFWIHYRGETDSLRNQYEIDNELCDPDDVQSGQCQSAVRGESAQDSSLYDVILGLLAVAKFLGKIIAIFALASVGAFIINTPITNQLIGWNVNPIGVDIILWLTLTMIWMFQFAILYQIGKFILDKFGS